MRADRDATQGSHRELILQEAIMTLIELGALGEFLGAVHFYDDFPREMVALVRRPTGASAPPAHALFGAGGGGPTA